MRLVQAAMAVLLCACGLCAAGTNPTTRPAPEPPGVVVVPFDAPPNHPQLGADVPQNLRATLKGYVRGRVIVPADEPPAQDAAAAVRSARRYKAAIVIFGSVQVSEQAIRVTGQAIDASNGKALGGLRATGERSHVFQVEDDLAKQIVRALPSKWLAPKSLAVFGTTMLRRRQKEHGPPRIVFCRRHGSVASCRPTASAEARTRRVVCRRSTRLRAPYMARLTVACRRPIRMPFTTPSRTTIRSCSCL